MKEKPPIPESFITDVDGVMADGTSNIEFIEKFFLEVAGYLGFTDKLLYFTNIEYRSLKSSSGAELDDKVIQFTVNQQVIATALLVRTPFNYLQHLFAHYLDNETMASSQTVLARLSE